MSSPAPSPGSEGPVPGDLQFEHAEPLPAPGTPSGTQCGACKQPIEKTYFHAQGVTVCEGCAERIQTGQQAPPAISLARAALYGAGAALAGSILYAAVSIITGFEIGLIAILVGFMVGKAVRHGSNDRGGRPQQILAVVLTYFAITTSYIPVFINAAMKEGKNEQQQADSASKQAAPGSPQVEVESKPPMSFGKALMSLLLLAAVAPFLSLTSGVGALISLFIIFIGLQRAWHLTGRSDLLIMGPYEVEPAPAP